jgi:hypothetical protein
LPPRSSDLNILDFNLTGHFQSLMKHPVDDVEPLRNRTVADFQKIRDTPGIWDRLLVAMRRRAEACVQAGGGHM